MVAREVIIITLLVLAIFGPLTFLIIRDASMPYEDVDRYEAYKFAGHKIQTEIEVVVELNDKTELEFLLPIFIPVGDSTMVMFIPIFDDYKVFTSDAGIYLAFDDLTPSINSNIIVRGDVQEDKSGAQFVIEVHEWKYRGDEEWN